MRIGVVGGGSVGLLVSGYLFYHHDVTLYVRRDEQKKVLQKEGLFFADMTDPLFIHTLLLEEMKEADCFIICVKQHQIESVISKLHQQNRQVPLLFLQNGMGHINKIQDMQNNLYVGVVEHGAFRMSDNHVLHTGKGAIKIASYMGNDEQLTYLIDQLNEEIFPFEKELDWEKMLAKKLIVNAVINPLTALFDVTNQEIINNYAIYQLATQLCYEAALVLDLDYELELNRMKEIALQTGENMSSMLMDIKSGRQTENEAISGYLVNKYHEDIPFTTFVYKSIKALEIRNRTGK